MLLVDNQPGVRRLVEIELVSQGFRVASAETAEEAIAIARESSPALAIVEPLTPGTGLGFVARLRDLRRMPVILLTLVHDDGTQIQALNLGAEDYITKPFNPEELSARVRSVLRRIRAPLASDIVRAGGIEIDIERRTVRKDGELLPLSRMEWKLLLYFASKAGKVITTAAILKEVWGPEYADEGMYLRVWIHRLRAIIEPDPDHPSLIKTLPRVGYRFSAERMPRATTEPAWEMAFVS